jgi:hypothetical protein
LEIRGRAADGTAHVMCDFSVQKPDGTYSVRKQDVDCLSGLLVGSAGTIYLSRLLIGLHGIRTILLGSFG